MKIAIVVSRFNDFVTNQMLEECKRALAEEDIKDKDIDVHQVPGAFEIPAFVQKLIATNITKRYQGIVALGCIIQGETDHYEYLCQGITYGMQKVAIENEFPVIFGILTCKTVEQAVKRTKKGYEYGKNLVCLIKIYQSL